MDSSMATASPSSPQPPAPRARTLRLLYRLAVYLAVPLVCLMLLWRGLRDRSHWQRFAERFGYGARAAPHGVWLHAVSVGEVQASAALIAALRARHPRLPLTVTTFTPTGAARARALYGDQAQVCYIPFDLPGAVRRFLVRVQPRLAVISPATAGSARSFAIPWRAPRSSPRRAAPMRPASANLARRPIPSTLAVT
jgi:3-Deoxy-D-manno-octulosonic-acid transferase (kdotransferase)